MEQQIFDLKDKQIRYIAYELAEKYISVDFDELPELSLKQREVNYDAFKHVLLELIQRKLVNRTELEQLINKSRRLIQHETTVGMDLDAIVNITSMVLLWFFYENDKYKCQLFYQKLKDQDEKILAILEEIAQKQKQKNTTIINAGVYKENDNSRAITTDQYIENNTGDITITTNNSEQKNIN